MDTTRRTLLRAAGAGLALPATAGRVASQTDDGVALETVAEGFTAPVAFEAPAGDDRRFVADQSGQVYVVDGDGRREEPFLDVSDRMVDLNEGYDERGLLGLAFHPAFGENGRFYVRYSAPPREGTPSGYSHTFVLAEFTATADGTRADPDSERAVLEIPEPQSNHNAGDVAFGPDGFLYVGVGDGGGGGDRGTGHVDDWYDAVAGGNGQDVAANLLGSVLRIDVDDRDDGKGYAVPDDNPLVGREGLDEQYAWGFRNPWRFSFDGETLLVGDVGQNRYEEVARVERGGNYGWNVREGSHCYDADSCPTETPDGDPLRDPVIEYPHGGDGVSGVSVVGGYVYRGDGMPALDGRYVFADWRAGGRLFVADPTESGQWSTEVLPVATPEKAQHVLAFGRDPDDELYVCTSQTSGPSGESGAVHRLVTTGEAGGDDATTAASDPGDGTADATGADDEDETADGATTTPGAAGFGTVAGLAGVAAAALFRRGTGGRD